MSDQKHADLIERGQAVLGLELGSTRIKATLVSGDGQPLAAGGHAWENQHINGIWTYPMEEVWNGIAGCITELRADVKQRYGRDLSGLSAIGISGMMHGYLPADADGKVLSEFRTWRNNITEAESEALTELFGYPIPQRWTIAHLLRAIRGAEDHVPQIRRLATLASWVHYRLTGTFAIGLNEASGMFPVDAQTGGFNTEFAGAFDRHLADQGLPCKLLDILPSIIRPGEPAGSLSSEGAALLDPSGTLRAGIPFVAPEGDAGTGMIATNSIRPRTGNVSAGTSVFAMIVLDHPLSRVHPEIDLVLTPDGDPVAMAHSNNCTSDLDAWMGILGEAAAALGAKAEMGDVFAHLLPLGLEGDPDAGGMVTVPYVSGEHVTGFSEGRPMVLRAPGARFSLANFVRAHLFSAIAAMRLGLDILTEREGIIIEAITGHGGFFKTGDVGQRVMAAATGARCTVLETAGEGGAWGMALLAAYMVYRADGESLADYLDRVFASASSSTVDPDPEDIAGYATYLERYRAALEVERAAVKALS